MLAASVAFIMAGNILIVNQYIYQLVRFGPSANWSDAIFPLANGISTFNASTIFIGDWDMTNPLTAIAEGSLPLRWGVEPFMTSTPSESQKKDASLMFAEPHAIWLAHTEENEAFTGINSRLEKLAGAMGYRKVIAGTFQDRHGRRIFEAFRLVPSTTFPTALNNSNR